MRTINIKFPLEDDKVKNNLFQLNEITREALKSNLLLLLLTNKGERYYQSDYGIDIRRFLFDPNDGQTHSSIEDEIRNAVKTFIPELNILSVEIFTGIDDLDINLKDNQINIVIDFTYSDDTFSEVDSLSIIV